ncbi:MAG: RICIN domain-containing protein [Myxococcota bacterium]
MRTIDMKRYAFTLTMLLAAACGAAPEDEDVQQAFAPGAWRLQNTEATFARRCVVSAGTSGAVVGGGICNNQNENQGYTYDTTSLKKNWLRTQGTGPAKCLAVTAANTLVNAVCTESTANQTWSRLQITGTSRFIYTNAGKCLTMPTDGVLSVATCTPGTRNQEWVQGNDLTLNEILNNGPIGSTDVPTGPPDVVVPATAGTIAYTGGAITNWDLTYIKYQPTNVFFESRGIVVVGRDQWNAPRFYALSLAIDDPRTPKDIHHTMKTILPDTQAPQFIDINIVNGAPKTKPSNNIPNVTSHSTAVALAIRDIAAYRTAHGFGPAAAARSAAAAGVISLPFANFVTALASDSLVDKVVAVDALALELLGCPECAAFVLLTHVGRKLFPDNPPNGTPTCASQTINVDGGTDQCVAHPPPACPPCGGTGQPACINSCAVQNSHGLPTTTTHGGPIPCSQVIAPHPGLSCSKSPIPPSNTSCWLDCTQTHSTCGWAWCRIPPK